MAINFSQWPEGTGILDLSELPVNYPMEKLNFKTQNMNVRKERWKKPY